MIGILLRVFLNFQRYKCLLNIVYPISFSTKYLLLPKSLRTWKQSIKLWVFSWKFPPLNILSHSGYYNSTKRKILFFSYYEEYRCLHKKKGLHLVYLHPPFLFFINIKYMFLWNSANYFQLPLKRTLAPKLYSVTTDFSYALWSVANI